MFQGADIFEENYKDYRDRIAAVDLGAIADRLGVAYADDQVRVRFFDKDYWVSKNGMTDAAGNRPDYVVCVILAKYLLLCPDQVYHDPEWASFKDFKRTSHFTNVNFFTTETEQFIVKHFAGKPDALSRACEKMGGISFEGEMSYDLSMQFKALPRLSLLLLYNDKDAEFPAQGTVLFQKHAEFYLDPESLAMTSAMLARSLVKAVRET